MGTADTDMFSEQDVAMMHMALNQARQASEEGEIPIGAVITVGSRIIATAHNMTERLNDVTAHAEMLAITAAENALGAKYLSDCTLYVTVEPCAMCAGAIGWAQLKRIVVGAGDPKRGYSTMYSTSPFHPRAHYTTGLLADECSSIVTDFFKKLRL